MVTNRIGLAGLLALLVFGSSASASFPGGNGKLAFVRSGQIWVVNADNSAPQEISPAGAARDPAISPDGRFVAYELGRDLAVTALDGSGTRIVTTGGHNDQFPAWSPDGKRIVFHRADDYDLFVINVDGSGLGRLTSDGSANSEYEPDWSPDGGRIAYEVPGCMAGDGQVCVFVMNADGSGIVNLTPEKVPAECPDVNPGVGAYGNSSNPSWSPDGSRIAFTGSPFHCQSGSGIAGHDIWVMNADGSGKTDLTPDAHDFTYDERPTWSPDGKQIAFQSDRLDGGNNGQREILVMPAGGLAAGDAVRVLASDTPGFDPHPSWGSVPQPTLIGGPGDDLLNGTTKSDVMKGLGGNDIINGLQGDDSIDGGSGDDRLSGSEGNDRLTGGVGRDTLTGSTGNDRLDGGSGNDKLDGGPGTNSYSGGAGNDSINSANGKRETVNCGPGKDSVRADRSDRVSGCEKVKRVR